jgi:hypothetical protein
MPLRAPSMFPLLYPRRTPALVREDQHFIDQVMALGDRRKDTAQIAKELFETEAVVCVALQAGREQRRRDG